MNRTLSKAVLTIVLSLAAASANAEYTFSLLGTLGGCCSGAVNINNFGQIAGYANTPGNQSQHATLWSEGNVIDLDVAEAFSLGIGINNQGIVAGWRVSDTDHATLWNGASSVKLSDSNSRAFTVNDAGEVVGYSISAGAVHATLWSEFGATDLGTLGGLHSIAYTVNNLGQVVGYSNIEGDVAQHATLWNGTSTTDLGTLGGSFSSAISINDQGQIVGVATSASGASYATLWNGTLAVALETLGGPQTFLPSINDNIVGNKSLQSFAWDINNSGQIVGYSNITDGLTTRATLWNNTTPIDLNTLLTASDVNAGWVLVEATGINDKGSIVGTASNTLLGIPYTAFLLSPVPEAETSAMLLMGAGVMGFIARRRKQTTA